MILFAAPAFESMAAALRCLTPELSAGAFHADRFPDGELFVQIDAPVAGEPCLILGSIAPPDAQLISTLLLAHTLRKERARQITGVFPYLAYSRQDKNKPGGSLAAAWTGALACASGLNRIVTIDVHSPEDERLSPVPLTSLSPAALFGEALNRNQLTGATIIAPDEGAIPRCKAMQAAAGIEGPIAWFEKHRGEVGIEHTRFHGEVGAQALLVDDVLDTGATLISASQRLLCSGVEDIQIMVTHGLFTGDEWRGLWELGVSRIFVTDSVPGAATPDPRIVTLPVVPLLTALRDSCL